MADDEGKHVFVSYVKEDAKDIDKLCSLLDAAQIPYWRDRKSLAPGDQWKQKIREAIASGALVFLACFSDQSRARGKSYMNEELTLAIGEFRKLAPGATWLIPVRFDDGHLPDWDLGAGRTISDLNHVDLFGDNYASEAVALTTTISRIMGTPGLDAATMRASIEEADATARPVMMRRMTKEMVLDPSRRIQLADLVAKETQRVLADMRDEERFPSQRLDGTHEDQVVRCAEFASAYWELSEPLCASLQVAIRWADPQGLMPWASSLRAVTSEAAKSKSGVTALLGLRHIPALTMTFTTALAATGQGRWDNLKALLVDTTVPHEYRDGRQAIVQAEYPWTPFSNGQDLIPNVVARAATNGESSRDALTVFTSNEVGKYHTPVAEWLHAILQPHFTDQYPDEGAYDDAFDRAEVILGLVSQDLENHQAANDPEQNWKGRSQWFGRSTWRARRGRSNPLDDIASEIESQGTSWAPLSAGLFGGDLDRATTALSDYAETFNQIKASRF